MAEKKSINLLEERNAPLTFWERIYTWVTNTCRVIVIVVEAIVLVAFGLRFYYDRQLSDIEDEIEKEASILQNYQQQEQELRELQINLTAYSEIWDNSSSYKDIITEINGIIPKDASELRIGFNDNKVTVSGIIDRESISDLEGDMKNSQTFVNVTLTNITSEDSDVEDEDTVVTGGEGFYSFTISAEIVNYKSRVKYNQTE